LQKELAVVLAEIDKVGQAAPVKVQRAAPPAKAPVATPAPATECPHCGAKFSRAMKFCGECGKAMA
jgi:membrane protease subunit (stomatin/prohibitin family)